MSRDAAGIECRLGVRRVAACRYDVATSSPLAHRRKAQEI
jgi:hypothetical protein